MKFREAVRGRLTATVRDKGMLATDDVREMSMPNFNFHITTAYSILRHLGVDLGKQKFIGGSSMRDV